MAACSNPYNKHDPRRETLPVLVPCGKCANCKARQVSAWSIRLVNESQAHDLHEFITLTYDTNHADITNNGFLSLSKVHIQAFFKALRKHLPPGTVKYFAAGEYGGQTSRPHYHLILFGATKEAISKSWNLGAVHYGDSVSPASIGYCLKYILKPSRIPMHARDDRVPEFRLVSKGMGLAYLTPAMVGYHQQNLTECFVTVHGTNQKAAMPRYYKDKIYTNEQRAALRKPLQDFIQARQETESKEFESWEIYKQTLTERAIKALEKQAQKAQNTDKL